MRRLYWTLRLLRDIALLGIVDSRPGLSLALLLLVLLGLLITAAQVSAPFIYTLF
ncbi:MAG: hypothetical protein KC620_07290 [Myxococcales bacterium]|nr:hypothetical protein [Myxococcales bacterium]